MPDAPPFRRVLVKLSGEALAAPDGYWLHPPTLASLAADIARTRDAGIQVALVVGGGKLDSTDAPPRPDGPVPIWHPVFTTDP